jgi:tRNA (mo5U34)-methyltransferase
MVDQDVARKLVQARPWHQDFEIIPGVRTHGTYDPTELWNVLQLPSELHGLSLADVGASNGYFSFAARQRGARVVAFDYRHKDNSGFGLAQYINGLDDIEHHHINVLDITEKKFGQFDIVLALGLLYHVADPYRSLANCAALSRDRLFIESYCIDSLLAPGLADQPVMRFISDPERFPDRGQPNTDRSNFWGFTAVCLQRLLEDVGFAVHRTIFRRERVLIEAHRAVSDDAATRLRLAYSVMSPETMLGDPNDPNGWRIF